MPTRRGRARWSTGLARDEHEEADSLGSQSEDWALTPGKERALIGHLPFFVALAENRHFGRAATRLAMSQSALTRRIQSLEMELGVNEDDGSRVFMPYAGGLNAYMSG